MKVLLISNMYPSPAEPSFGVFVAAHERLLQERGITFDRAVIRYQPPSAARSATKYFRLFAQCLSYTSRRHYDLIHCHYPYPIAVILPLLKRLGGCPLVITCHGGDVDPARWHHGRRAAVQRQNQLRRALHAADHLFCVSNHYQQLLIEQYQMNPALLSVVNMGVDRAVFYPLGYRDELRQQLGYADGRRHFVIAGHVTENKGTGQIIEAVAQLSQTLRDQTCVHLFGRLLDTRFVEQVAEHKLQQQIRFEGVVSQSELARQFNVADAVLMPSHREAFGLTAAEAMACGALVIASRTGGLAEIIQHRHNGYHVEPADSNSLRKAIEDVIGQTIQADIIRKNAIHRAAEFDMDRQVDRVLTTYRRLCCSTASPPDQVTAA